MALFLTTILKKDLNLYENCRETDKGSSVQSLPMLYVLDTLLTLCRYSAISGDEYSEQLRVRNIVGLFDHALYFRLSGEPVLFATTYRLKYSR